MRRARPSPTRRCKVKELEIQLKVATAERQHAEAIIYSISDAVLVTDPFDDLVLANESAARTFDFDLDKAAAHAGRPGRSTTPKVDRADPRDAAERHARAAGASSSTRSSTAAGRPHVQGHALLRRRQDRRSNPAGVVAVLHDMTKEKEVAEMKNDFVSNVCHELRTPLASIKAYVEMLIDGEADDEKTKREFYEVIQNEANRLGRLIDNILNISRIESGLVKINKQPQSLTVILKDALEVIAPQAKRKQITLDGAAHAGLLSDAGRPRHALPGGAQPAEQRGEVHAGGRHDHASQTAVDEAKQKVITRICDTGVGIPPKDLPFVFDKFYRAEANNRMAKGTGLGLSLVKHIVETVHHGRIFVESQVGQGQLVRVRAGSVRMSCSAAVARAR